VEKDVNEAVSLEVDRTPSIFINGVYYPDISNLAKGIDAALAGK
jgi:protein-disulfide isomerase